MFHYLLCAYEQLSLSYLFEGTLESIFEDSLVQRNVVPTPKLFFFEFTIYIFNYCFFFYFQTFIVDSTSLLLTSMHAHINIHTTRWYRTTYNISSVKSMGAVLMSWKNLLNVHRVCVSTLKRLNCSSFPLLE